MLGWLAVLPAAAQVAAVPDSKQQSYSITESGRLSYLGVEVQVQPELGPPVITGFWVTMTYDDPVVANDTAVRFLETTFFPVDCSPGFGLPEQQPFTWYNKRGTGFAVTFEQRCRQVEPGKSIPYLEFRIWCTDPEKEQRYLQVVEDNQVFEIVPQGQVVKSKNEVYDVLEIGQKTFELVSTVSTVLDVVMFTRGGLTASNFVMKLVVGVALDSLVNAGFEYAKSELGYEVRFHHLGWQILCRLCGHTFSRQHLTHGELLQCPRHTCDGESYIRFY